MLAVDATKQLGEFKLDVVLRAPTPGVVALFGRSGCGKTTLTKILAGLVAPDLGHAHLNDDVLFDTARGVAVRAEHRRIGYVFQDARLFPHLSVDGNLRYAERRAARRAKSDSQRGLERADAESVFLSRDHVIALLELEPLLARRTHQLSGGERQRVAIGRALLSQPRLLLFDEPLAALDHARRAELLPYLELLRDQLSIPMVYVSHQFDEVMRLATHVAVMERGTVVAQGDVNHVSMDRHLRDIIGAEALGAVVDGVVHGTDVTDGLTRVRVGGGELRLPTGRHAAGAALRIQVLARDIIVATRNPDSLSVRNHLAGTVAAITSDDAEADLVAIDIGSQAAADRTRSAGPVCLMARITKAATRDLGLEVGLPVWALIKTVSLRGHEHAMSRR